MFFLVSLLGWLRLLAIFNSPAGHITVIGLLLNLAILGITTWLAIHLLRTGRRLGRLLRDPEKLMSSRHEQDENFGSMRSIFTLRSGWKE